MSSLWTPGGEHRVPDDRGGTGGGGGDNDSGDGADDLDDAEDEERAEVEAAMQAQLDEARERLASVPAEEVVANHAMGLFELGAIHLSMAPPNLPEAALAIDAMGALVEGLGERLGPNASVLQAALAQIRMAFVQVKSGLADT